jgi:hypothetical protein
MNEEFNDSFIHLLILLKMEPTKYTEMKTEP